MWERLIRIRPSLIVLAFRSFEPSEIKKNNKLFQVALDNGYKITEKDLKRNKAFCKSKFVMEKAIEIDPNFIKHFESDNYNDWVELARKAIENGYQPAIQDLKDNPFLGYSDQIVQTILTEETVDQITIDDIKEYSELARNDMLFKHLISINPNNITHYEGYNQEIFRLAISANNGYQPSVSDLDNRPSLGKSDDIIERLIKQTQDGNIIFKYKGTNENIFKLAFNLGIDEEKMIDLIKQQYSYSNFKKSKCLMMNLIEKDSSLIEYYEGKDIDVYTLAFEKGYIPSDYFFEKHKKSDEILELMIKSKPELISDIIKEDPMLITGFGGNDNLLFIALNNGYIPSEEEMQQLKPSPGDNIFSLLIDNKPEYIKYYEGIDSKIYEKALQHGYVPSIDSFKKINFGDLIVSIVKLRPDYLEYYDDYYKLCIKILAFDYIPSIEEVTNDYYVSNNLEIMKKLIMHNLNYIKCCGEEIINNVELYETAIDNGYSLDDLLVDEHAKDSIYKSDKIMKLLIQTKDLNYIKKYEGINIEIFKLVLGKYNPGVPSFVKKSEHSIEDENNAIIYLLTYNNFEIVIENEEIISTKYKRLFKIAIGMGYIPKIENINSLNIDLINDNIMKQIIDAASINECIKYLFYIDYKIARVIQEKIKEYILKRKNIEIPEGYFDLLYEYTADKVVFINNYPKFNNFLSDLEIDENKFVQYNISSNYNWLSDILSIIDSGKKEEFKTVKEYYFKSYYLKNIDNISDALQMKAFITILKNYVRYPELCLNIIENNTPLQGELSEKLDFLFESNDSFDESNRPKTIDDLENLDEKISNRYLSELKNIDAKSIKEVKDIICRLLFNNDLYFIQNQLRMYGDTIELRQLMFDNRENEELCSFIKEMMIYTSMMESIIEADDKQYLIDMAEKIINNMKLSSKCMMLFTTFDEKMRELYSEELSSSLTALRDDISLDSLIDKTMSSECGVEVLDFSDKQYCLLGHVKSYRETIEEVVLGKSTAERHTICLSAISHRNQVYYQYARGDIIFGYDNIPKGSFIQSSTGNMGSNGSVKNSLEIKGISNRTQRGTLKTSEAPTTHNSEIHCFREGIIPKYIILPGGRKPTEEEVSIAKKYGLKFAKTQEIGTEILNPQKIDDSLLEHDKTNIEHIEIETIKGLRDSLTATSSQGPRKIAIFTDSHALFEPTLAILEDARKSGITEIYSLGDNIGTGPNPREVLELLDEYGVESLQGNHEIYATLGMGPEVVEEAKRNSTWTRAKLTQKQIETINNNPEQRVIEIGGQKVLLTHFAYDYNNTGHKLQIPEGVTHTFQGHKHYLKEEDDITTLRAAAIGLKEGEAPEAYYIVLVEKPGGGFDIEKHIVKYDTKSLGYDIKSSDMSSGDKSKIEEWAGVKR